MIDWIRFRLSELFLSIAVVLIPEKSWQAKALAGCLELFLSMRNGVGTATIKVKDDQ